MLQRLLPPTGTGPAWPTARRAFVRVSAADGIDLVASDGLTDGPTGGLRAEVVLPVRRASDPGWRTALLVQVAQNLADRGLPLTDGLQRHGVLSLSLPGIDAPADWRGPDGRVGALLGVPLPGMPDRVVLPAGPIALAGVVPLRPDELRRILDGGAAARAEVARALTALPAEQLSAPERSSVLTPPADPVVTADPDAVPPSAP